MKKKFLMPLFLMGTATAVISYPVHSFAAPDAQEEVETEADESTAEGESSEDGENPETEATIEETTAPPPDNSYYVIVSGDEGTKLYQQASSESALSINIPIPKNTILHVLDEATDESGISWGFVNYADLKEGYVKLSDLSTIQAKTAKEVVEDKFNGNWGKEFVKVNGSGTPVSFNSLTPEELKAAEESNAAEAKKGGTKAAETAESTEVETREDGSPVIEVYMETNENGEPIPMETDEDGNIIVPESETETEAPEEKSGGFSIVSFFIGFITVILLEVLVAGAMILIRKLKLKKKAKSEEETPPDEGDSGGKKKKGFKLPIPKISLPKIKLAKIKIGGKKKKKGDNAE
ncbi:hypothetical protein [Oribacterium sp. P6A1]|uniref:hypothetical protein n=1 Tax=Oribacterium sp. P6A1 TaxID=1410612 RepID=UPI0005676ED9|nr:hypothetical protein [Oribacterium sp. P6A1]